MKRLLCIIIVIAGMSVPEPLIATEETLWTEWPDNPIVFGEGENEAYYPSVLYDVNLFNGNGDYVPYKMWVDKHLQHYISDDGVDWTFVAYTDGDLIGNVRHPVVKYYEDGFDGTDLGTNPSDEMMYYRIWYWNANYLFDIQAIYYAESPDGMNWYNCQPITQENPLIIDNSSVSNWNRGSYSPADVLYNLAATNNGTDWTFTMYYDGTDGGDESIGIAFSADGIHWTGYDSDDDGAADPVLMGSDDADAWDGGSKGYVSRCTVIIKDGEYKMWYSGGQTSMQDGIGYASSTDGLNWTKHPENPVFHKNDGVEWRADRTYCPAVSYDPAGFSGNGESFPYKMWFAGESGGAAKVGYAAAGTPMMECFGINRAKIERFPRENDDMVNVTKASFLAELPDAVEPVVFSLSGVVLIDAVFGHFAPRQKQKYVYHSAHGEFPIVHLILDFGKYTWKAFVKKTDLSFVEPDVTFELQIGVAVGSENIAMEVKGDDLEYRAEEEVECVDRPGSRTMFKYRERKGAGDKEDGRYLYK